MLVRQLCPGLGLGCPALCVCVQREEGGRRGSTCCVLVQVTLLWGLQVANPLTLKFAGIEAGTMRSGRRGAPVQQQLSLSKRLVPCVDGIVSMVIGLVHALLAALPLLLPFHTETPILLYYTPCGRNLHADLHGRSLQDRLRRARQAVMSPNKERRVFTDAEPIYLPRSRTHTVSQVHACPGCRAVHVSPLGQACVCDACILCPLPEASFHTLAGGSYGLPVRGPLCGFWGVRVFRYVHHAVPHYEFLA